MFRNRTVNRLLSLIVALTYILVGLSVFSFKVYAQDLEAAEAKAEKMENLTTREAVELVHVTEQADTAGIKMARQTVNEYERAQEDKRLKKEEKKKKERAARIAKEKKEQKERAARRIAHENTVKTGGNSNWNGRRISRSAGSIMGPSGKETYYNLDMSVCVRIMRRMGFSEAEYPYAVRSDGVKTLGGYVMVAANLGIRPKGTLIETSVGTGIVVDTGGFAQRNKTQLDIAVNW